MEWKIDFRRETVVAGRVGAENNSQCYRRDLYPCIPDGAGFLNRDRVTLESAVLLSGVCEGNKDAPTLTTARRVV